MLAYNLALHENETIMTLRGFVSMAHPIGSGNDIH